MKFQHIIENSWQYGNKQQMFIAVNNMRMQLHERVSNLSHHSLNFRRGIMRNKHEHSNIQIQTRHTIAS